MKKPRKNLFTHSPNHFFTFNKPVKNLLPYSPNPLFPSKNAFTLTEVLVALTIVGVISALVLPAVITKYQTKAFDSAYRRETQVIESAVEGLAISENKVSFFDTMMYKDAEPENYDDSSKVFINKYLRASKICSTGNDCFAKKYYEYEDNDKKVYTPEFKGTCAKLKNGPSICIQPQIGGEPVKGIIDINGDKGPNVLSKDLREFHFAVQTRNSKNNTVAEVNTYDFAPLGACAGRTCGCGDLPPCEDPCAGLTCGCGSLPQCAEGEECRFPDPNNSSRCCSETATYMSDSCCSNDEFRELYCVPNLKCKITNNTSASCMSGALLVYGDISVTSYTGNAEDTNKCMNKINTGSIISDVKITTSNGRESNMTYTGLPTGSMNVIASTDITNNCSVSYTKNVRLRYGADTGVWTTGSTAELIILNP